MTIMDVRRATTKDEQATKKGGTAIVTHMLLVGNVNLGVAYADVHSNRTLDRFQLGEVREQAIGIALMANAI